MSMNLNPASAQTSTNDSAHVEVQVPRLLKKIDLSDLGSSSIVKKMTFSPDGRFLAIVDNPTHMKTDIVVWDLQLNKKQSQIHCPLDFGDMGDLDLLWIGNGKIITFGAKRQWDPITGDSLPDNPVIGRAARLNKDGSKLLTIVGAIGEPSYVYIYDTSDWTLKKLYVDGLSVGSAAWTSEGKILVRASATRETLGKTLDDHVVATGFDVALRLLDPNGKNVTKAIWFPAKPTGDPKWPFAQSFSTGDKLKSNFVTNEIFLPTGQIIDGDTLHIRRFEAREKDNDVPGGNGMAISNDGRFLYLKGQLYKHGLHPTLNVDDVWVGDSITVKNSIIDVASGALLTEFDGALNYQGDISISPDGTHLALGNGDSVLIFVLQ